MSRGRRQRRGNEERRNKDNAETQRTQRLAENVVVVMSKQMRLRVGFGVLGLAIAAALFAYLEVTNYSSLNRALLVAAVTLCPPSLLSILFMDAKPHTIDIGIVWFVIALINGALYSAVGAGLGRYLWKTDRPTTN
jgi:hypothetical protein